MAALNVPLKIAGYAGVFAVLGAAFGALTCAKNDLDEPDKRHRSIRVLEKFDGELVHMVLTISKMNDRHAKQFFAMHRALVRLITLETNLGVGQFPKRVDWPHVAALYSYEIEKQGNYLKSHASTYEEGEQIVEHIDTIVKLSKDLAHNVALTNDQIHLES